ncbi:MAG: 2,3-bisphosphoglycerate-independent phosphoglycerate mutase, partial [Solirubrobacteraceae bacterium]
TCLRRIVDCVAAAGGVCVITADHGNAEEMLGPDGGPGTTHSCNRVPLVVTVPGLGLAARGTLADVAPTVLELLGMEAPAEMTGHSLVRAVTVVSG